jgi:hypothetical protein
MGRAMNASRIGFLGAWVTIILLGTSHVSEASSFVLSDVDDTVKITGVESWSDAIPNAVCSREAFPGMASLYRGILGTDSRSGLTFVTGSPSLLKGAIEEFLELNGFAALAPSVRLFTRNAIGRPETWTFKTQTLDREIRSILSSPVSRRGETQIFLFGDDAEKDPDVYWEMQRRFPGKVARVFIRRVREGAKTLLGQVPITSSVEAALVLWEDGTLPATSVEAVIQDFYDQKTGTFYGERAYPDFAVCPPRGEWLTERWESALAEAGEMGLVARVRDFEADSLVRCTQVEEQLLSSGTRVGRDLN